MSVQPFDITASCTELKNIDLELKRLKSIVKDLSGRKKVLEEKIQVYLDQNQNVGVEFKGVTFLKETKQKTKALTKKEKTEKIQAVLLQHVPDTAAKVLTEISEATKGLQTMQQKLTMNYHDQKQKQIK